MKSITIPSSVTWIGENAFERCDALRGVYISDLAQWCQFSFAEKHHNPLYFAYKLYVNGELLTGLTVSDEVEKIGSYAFVNCIDLTSVVIPETVTTIERAAFNGCAGITAMTIPYIGGSKTVGSGDMQYPFGHIFGTDGYDGGYEAYQNYIEIDRSEEYGDNFVIPTALKTVTVSGGQIWKGSFQNCYQLTKVNISEGVTGVGSYAFAYCENLTEVILPEGVTAIENNAFDGCTSMKSITIPSSVTQIGENAFGNCGALRGVYISDLAKWCSFTFEEEYHNPLYYARNLYLDGQLVTNLQLPSGITEVKKYAFINAECLKAVQLPAGVEYVGQNAFTRCTGLIHVMLPESVAYIEGGAFYNCTSLVNVTAGSGLTGVGYDAFGCCNKLHVTYTGTWANWQNISMDWYNEAFGEPECLHVDASAGDAQWIDNCYGTGLYCTICDKFLVQEAQGSGSHSYTDASDTTCNICGATKTVSSIAIYELPAVLEYAQNVGQLDVTDGMLMVTYSDGTQLKVAFTAEMVSGFDNTKLGDQTLTVTYGGKTATYTVQVVQGASCTLSISQLPNKLYYLVNDSLDLTGLAVIAKYENGNQVTLQPDALTVKSLDLSTAGKKTVYVGIENTYVSFEIYVHEKTLITIDSSVYPESDHKYSAHTDDTKTFSWEGASALYLTFTDNSYTETGYDFVYLYDGAGKLIGKYSGTTLNGLQVTVPGDSFSIRLTSDGTVHKYGYAFASIEALAPVHAFEQTECSVCGRGSYEVFILEKGEYVAGFDSIAAAVKNCGDNQYIKLYADAKVEISLKKDLYIDLNGYNLSGVIAHNDFKIYGIDSTTNQYTCYGMGYFNCVDEEGNTVVPERYFKTTAEMTGDIRSYMAIATESGYSFHRFYLGITNSSLKPDTMGVGYKAVFYGDSMVKAELDSYGYTLQLEGNGEVTRTKDAEDFVSGKTLTLRINNFDAVNFGETRLYASASMVLSDGTVIQSALHGTTLREMVEAVNASYTSYSASQLAAVKTMITNNPIMQTWTVDNLYKKES